jgi:hypothetical protein
MDPVYSQRWGCEMGEWHPHRTWDEAAMSFPEAVTSPKNSKSGPLHEKVSPRLKATAIHNKWISLCEDAAVRPGATFQSFDPTIYLSVRLAGRGEECRHRTKGLLSSTISPFLERKVRLVHLKACTSFVPRRTSIKQWIHRRRL